MKTDRMFDSACPLTAALFLAAFLLSGCAQGNFSASEKTGDTSGAQVYESEDTAEPDQEKRLPLSFPDLVEDEFPKIDGSTATLPISQALYRLWSGADSSAAQEKISHSKTMAAYYALLEDSEDSPSLVIAYAPDAEMLSLFSSTDSPVEIKSIGRDALVFMTNAQNPVHSLTQKEIRGIYSGKIVNWKECGGPDQLIQAFQRPEGSGSQNLMEKLVMQGETMAEAPQSKVFGEMGEILDALSSYDNAEASIGYSVYYYARNMYERPQLSFLSVDGVMPSNESIRSRQYPYTSAFYAVIRRDEPKDSAPRKLYDWLTSEDGQALLNELGYVGETEHYRKMPAFFGAGTAFEENTANGNNTAKEENTEQKKNQSVYIADGELFFGEQGTLILDDEFHFLKFLPDMVTTGMKPLVRQERSRPLVLLDMAHVSPELSVPRRIYRADQDAWESFPEENQEDDLGRTDEQSSAENEKLKEEFLSAYPDPEQFAQHHPDILKEYNVSDPKEIGLWQSWSESDTVPAAYVFSKGEHWYAYDASGSLLAAVDARELQKELGETGFDLSFEMDEKMGILIYLLPPVRFNEEESLLTVGFGSGTQFLHYFKDGSEVQKVKIQPQDESSYIVCAGDGFYLERSQNYLSIYSPEGKLLKRFLGGWLQND